MNWSVIEVGSALDDPVDIRGQWSEYDYYYYYYFYYYIGTISLGVRRKGKTGKHGKVEVKREWWVLSQPPYSPQGNGR